MSTIPGSACRRRGGARRSGRGAPRVAADADGFCEATGSGCRRALGARRRRRRGGRPLGTAGAEDAETKGAPPPPPLRTAVGVRAAARKWTQIAGTASCVNGDGGGVAGGWGRPSRSRDAHRVDVFNNHKGIRVVMHKEHDSYVSTLVFGHLLTGFNLDDAEFVAECLNAVWGLKFRQVFRGFSAPSPGPSGATTPRSPSGRTSRASRWNGWTSTPSASSPSARTSFPGPRGPPQGGRSLAVHLHRKKLPPKDLLFSPRPVRRRRAPLRPFDRSDERRDERSEVGAGVSAHRSFPADLLCPLQRRRPGRGAK